MKGIYKRSDSNKYWIAYVGPDGRTIRESTGSDKFRDAQALLQRRKQAVLEGKTLELKRIQNHTFKELAEQYLAWLTGRQRSEKVKGYIIKQLLGRYANLPLRRFTPVLVEELQTWNINRGIKASTNNKMLNVLKHMFRKAVDWEMVEEETLKRIRGVKLLQDDSKRLRYLSREESGELVEACDEHLKPIVITALNTGMRRGEILRLTWEQVDMRHGLILLHTTKNGERREIPINSTLMGLLKNLVRRLDVPYVFYEPKTGNPYKGIKRSFRTALRRSGIHDFRFHDLRHTFASQLVMAGADLTTVKELLGHKSLTMTLRYAHLAPEHKRNAVELLDDTAGGKSTSRLLHVFNEKGLSHGV